MKIRKYFLIFFLLSTSVYANIDCNTCEGIVPWQTGEIYNSFNNCGFKITFHYRECPPEIREMELVNIEFFGDCVSPYTTDLIVELAAKLVLNDAFRVFNSLYDSTSNNKVHLGMSCCWETSLVPGNNQVQPCDDGCNCCMLYDLRSTYDPNTGEYVNQVYQNWNLNPSSSSHTCSQGCNFGCGILESITTGTPLPPFYEPVSPDYSLDFSCTNYCDSTYQGYQTRLIPLDNGCSVSATFLNVWCVDGSNIVKLVDIDQYDIYICNIYNAGELAADVLSKAIELNVLNLQPGNHKFLLSSCWRFVNNNYDKVIPCYNTVCCEYEIEYDSNCNRELPTNYNVKGVYNCYGEVTSTLTTECSNACRYLDELFFFED